MRPQTKTNRGSSRQPARQFVKPGSPANPHTVNDSIKLMGARMSVARNAEIYGENEPAAYLYKVVSGSVRTYKMLTDGRRQIGAFYFPGDIFGLEAGDVHTLSAEAIVDCKILVIKRSALVSRAKRDNEIARELWMTAASELQHVQAHSLLLIKTAEERVAGFLLEMATRLPAGNEIDLPMRRQDIADYLGLTIETVSRTIALLERNAAIAVPDSRHIVLSNRAALNRLNA
jgi:CRP/FNR family nitrogen fixation transcriptional regulator